MKARGETPAGRFRCPKCSRLLPKTAKKDIVCLKCWRAMWPKQLSFFGPDEFAEKKAY